VGKFVGKELQGDVATEFEVFCFVDHTHPASPDPAEDVVMGNCLPNGLRRRGHWVDMLGGDEGKVNVRWHRRNGLDGLHGDRLLRL